MRLPIFYIITLEYSSPPTQDQSVNEWIRLCTLYVGQSLQRWSHETDPGPTRFLLTWPMNQVLPQCVRGNRIPRLPVCPINYVIIVQSLVHSGMQLGSMETMLEDCILSLIPCLLTLLQMLLHSRIDSLGGHLLPHTLSTPLSFTSMSQVMVVVLLMSCTLYCSTAPLENGINLHKYLHVAYLHTCHRVLRQHRHTHEYI